MAAFPITSGYGRMHHKSIIQVKGRTAMAAILPEPERLEDSKAEISRTKRRMEMASYFWISLSLCLCSCFAFFRSLVFTRSVVLVVTKPTFSGC